MYKTLLQTFSLIMLLGTGVAQAKETCPEMCAAPCIPAIRKICGQYPDCVYKLRGKCYPDSPARECKACNTDKKNYLDTCKQKHPLEMYPELIACEVIWAVCVTKDCE